MKKMESEKMENEMKIAVQIADATGDTVVEMTQAETLDLVEQNSSLWVFMEGCLVSAATLANANWNEMAENETTVQLFPGLIGGI